MKKYTLFLLASALMFTFMACGRRSNSGKGELSTKNNVVYWLLADLERLNPYTSTDASSSYVKQMIWESLNGSNPRTNEDIPALASLPTISEDHLTYTYTMDPAAKWSDGKPVTSDDVIFSFKVVKNPVMINLQHLRNYVMSLDSVYNPDGDKGKVAFRLNKPFFDAHSILGGGYVVIIPKHVFDPKNITDKIMWADLRGEGTNNPAIKQFAEWFESPDIARDPKYMIGSGPYIFQGWQTNDRITLARDKDYWAQNRPWFDAYPDEIIYKTIGDQNAALTALKAKDLDVINQLRPEQYLNQINEKDHPFLKKDTIYYNAHSYIAWNGKRPMFADKRVRKALTMLIDRDAIITNILKGYAKKVDGPIIFTQPNHNPNVKQAEFNPEAAKKLLAEVGWTDSDGDGVLDRMMDGKRTPFKFVFQTNAGNETRKQILLVITEQFRKAGIQAEVSALEWSVFLENTKTHNFDAAYSALAGNAKEDEPYQSYHSSQSKNKGSNFYSFNNAEADRLMESIRTEFDKEKRYQMYYRFQEIVNDEQPVSYLFATPLMLAHVDRFDNVEFFRQRPCFDPRYWIVRGSGVKRMPGAIAMGDQP